MALVLHSALNSTEQPKCSVCIANYNGEQLLADCINSVLAQDCTEAIEIIVHDDASTDGSVPLLRKHYPQIELLASEANVGFCIANNRMVDHARGEYVLLLNNDATLLPDALSTLFASAAEHQPTGILTLPQYDWTSGALVDRGCLLDPFFNPIPNHSENQRQVAMVIGACLFIHTDLWRQLGGLPEWMESIAEDLYLCGQARLRGCDVKVAEASGYRHKQGLSFGGNRVKEGRLASTYRRRALSERNKTYALFILIPSPLMWIFLLTHLLLLGIEGFIICLTQRSLQPWWIIYFPAITAPAKNYGLLNKQRRLEQSQRRVGLMKFLSTSRLIPRKLQMFVRFGLPTLR